MESDIGSPWFKPQVRLPSKNEEWYFSLQILSQVTIQKDVTVLKNEILNNID